MPFVEKYDQLVCNDSTVKKEIYPFVAKEALYHWQWVQLCPSDHSQVMPWDEVDEADRIGYVKHPVAIQSCPDQWVQPGQCVDIVIHRSWGGSDMACVLSGWVCDSNGTNHWFEKDSAGAISYYTGPDATTASTPVGATKPPGGSSSDLECLDGWVEDANGDCFYFLTEKVVDSLGNTTRSTTYYTDPSLSVTATPVLPLSPKGSGDVQSDQITGIPEELTVTNTAIGFASIPADATGAVVQLTAGCIRFYVDGTSPTPTSGYALIAPGVLNLGCLTSDNQSGDVNEISNFMAISETADPATLTITYYKKV